MAYRPFPFPVSSPPHPNVSRCAAFLLLLCLTTCAASLAAAAPAPELDLTTHVTSEGRVLIRWYVGNQFELPTDHYTLLWTYGASSGEIELDAATHAHELDILAIDAALDAQLEVRVEARDASNRVVALTPTETTSAKMPLPNEHMRSGPRLPILEVSLVDFDQTQFRTLFATVHVDSSGYFPVNPLPPSAFSVYEDGELQTDCFAVDPTGARLLDFVYLIDHSGSMCTEIQDVVDNAEAFAESLVAHDYAVEFGYVKFGQSENGGNPIIMNGGALYETVAELMTDLEAVCGGGTEPGCAAVLNAQDEIQFRPGSQRVFLLITDEDSDGGDCGLAVEVCNANGTVVHCAVGCSFGHAQQDYCATDPGDPGLAPGTGGHLYAVAGPYSDILNHIELALGSNYVIRYCTDNLEMCVERAVLIEVTAYGETESVGTTYTPGGAPIIERTAETIALSEVPQVEGAPLPICAEIVDCVAPGIAEVTLYYRMSGSGAPYTLTGMVDQGGGLYCADIPGEDVAYPGVDYYIKATDGEVASYDPSTDPQGNPYSIAVLPNVAPVIEHDPVGFAPAGEDVLITATVTDGTHFVDAVSLFYRPGDTILYTEIGMTPLGGNMYSASIPGSVVQAPDGVDYYLWATDNLGLTATLPTPDDPFHINVGEEGYCLAVDPWDIYGQVIVSPGNQSGVDLVTITVTDCLGSPVPDALVEIDFSECDGTCIDFPNDGLAGVTDEFGAVTLDPRVGFCGACLVHVRVNGVIATSYDQTVTPDWNGIGSDGVVDQTDQDYFESIYPGGYDQCLDFNANAMLDPDDELLFYTALGFDENDRLCKEIAPEFCSVEPWDTYGLAFVSPGSQSGVDTVRVMILDTIGASVPEATVTLDFSACDSLCIDTPDAGLVELTDEEGVAVLDPRVGGCEECAVIVRANNVIIGIYGPVRSPDWHGQRGDGVVDAFDEAFFLDALLSQDQCADYTGDGFVGPDDEAMFYQALRAPDMNTHACKTADPFLSTVEPWDTYGQVFVSPGTQSGIDSVTITVLDEYGLPFPGVEVSIDLTDCDAICADYPDDGLSGSADVDGVVLLDPRAGGCADCEIVVRADSVVLRTYIRMTSPDWNGVYADGMIDSTDIAFFLDAYAAQDPCVDYNGDSVVDSPDSSLFAASLAAGDANSLTCFPLRMTVEPWDTYGQAFISPGNQSGVDAVTVTITSEEGVPFEGIDIELDFSACTVWEYLCIDLPDDGFTGTTGPDGVAILDPRAGGCQDCVVTVRANGIAVKSYPRVVSTDWDGSVADGRVDSNDEAYFLTGGLCADYDGDGMVGIVDLHTFALAHNTDVNDKLCSWSGVSQQTEPATVGRLALRIPTNPMRTREPLEVHFSLPDDDRIRLEVFDIRGALVSTIAEGRFPAGTSRVRWPVLGTSGAPLGTGVYFMKLQTSAGKMAHKVICVR
ncbi:MAG: VWA domain-containing protein [Candidatus Eisenbacteria sp.]|nr:VWA domain-containing protein [Candidatus Eisenbacteria bacterium]